MKIGIRQNWQEPSDSEIESDVAELRRLLDGVEGPREPHPAYYQNFLVRTRQRLDEQQARRRRFSPSVAWASLSAATLAVILVVGGMLPTSIEQTSGRSSSSEEMATSSSILSTEDANALIFGDEGDLAEAPTSGTQVLDNKSSILLSSEDVTMINAIMSEEDDEALLDAMIETGAKL
jgi:hypothetical protein